MLSKQNDINLSNYEEFFILYMDNELNAQGKVEVEEFIAAHPQLAEELEILMSTKLPVEGVSIFNKEDLFSSAMKLNVVDESLLLYLDNELPSAEKTIFEEKLMSDKDFALQYSFLLKTKLDASEKIQHPNKNELYRHAEKVGYFKVWMRVAAAIIVILLGSLFFLVGSDKTIGDPPVAIKDPAVQPTKTNKLPAEKKLIVTVQKDEPVLAKAPDKKKIGTPVIKNLPAQDKFEDPQKDVVVENNIDQTPRKREIIKFDVTPFTVQPSLDPINKTITHTAVTSFTPERKIDDDPTVTAETDGDFKPTKKGSTKGFLRKVTRFIERNTGIGTVNADNELLIGAVSLKLK